MLNCLTFVSALEYLPNKEITRRSILPLSSFHYSVSPFASKPSPSASLCSGVAGNRLLVAYIQLRERRNYFILLIFLEDDLGSKPILLIEYRGFAFHQYPFS